jgi:hypothetical protein
MKATKVDIHTHRVIVYPELKKVTTKVRMGIIKKRWASKVKLVGLFEID